MKPVAFPETLGNCAGEFSPYDGVAIRNPSEVGFRNAGDNRWFGRNNGSATNRRPIDKRHFANMLAGSTCRHFPAIHHDADTATDDEVDVVVLTALRHELVPARQFRQMRIFGERSRGRRASRQ